MGLEGGFSFKFLSPVPGIWFNELRSRGRQLTPDCACTPVCVRAHVRRVFPPLSPSVHVCTFGLPDYCGHVLTHTLSLFSEASPALETLHTHTDTHTHTLAL